jgi:hypothetical protein
MKNRPSIAEDINRKRVPSRDVVPHEDTHDMAD